MATPVPSGAERIGDLLLKEGMITKEQLEKAFSANVSAQVACDGGLDGIVPDVDRHCGLGFEGFGRGHTR